ncbi:MAG: alpha/beta fold hydrolase [Bacteroidota bacterium]
MELNFKTFGSGPALIILHGLFGSLDNWQTLARKYAAHFSVYIVDQRNHGKSPHTDAAFTYRSLADDLLAFMEQQGMYSASLLGHSMGGKVVMQFAAENESMVERMVVADMATRRYSPHHDAVLQVLASIPFAELDSRKAATEWMTEQMSDVATRQFLLKSLQRTLNGPHEFAWKFNFPVLYRDYDLILEAVEADFALDVPVLFLRGGDSNYVRDEYLLEIREIFPQAELATLEGAGHWLHADQPQAFFDTSLKFLLGS